MKTFICLICSLWLNFAVHAAELKFEPAMPSVEVDKEIELSVIGAEGRVEWMAIKGHILGSGTKVTYRAPSEKPAAGFDVVTVSDEEGHFGTVKIQVVPQPKVSLENVNWKIYTNKDHIKKLAYEPYSKWLWVATEGGLEERNIETGEVKYHNQQGGELPSNNITDIKFDDWGTLWVATTGGLARRFFSDRFWYKITRENSNLSDDLILSINVSANVLWVGTALGVITYPLDSIPLTNQFKAEDGLPKKPVSNIEVFPNSVMVFYQDGSVFTRNNDTSEWKPFAFTKDGSLTVEAITVDKKLPGVWIAGLHKISETQAKRIVYRLNAQLGKIDLYFDDVIDSDPIYYVNTLHLDSQNRLWIGTHGAGLGYIIQRTTGEWVGGIGTKLVPVEYITTLQSDNEGNLWIGSGDPEGWQSYGLSLLRTDGSWQPFGTSKLPSNNVSYLKMDAQDNLWVGTQRGVVKRTANGKWENINLSTEFFNSITSFVQDKQGGWWFGTFGEGLFYQDLSGNIININSKNSNLPTDFSGVDIDRYGNIWINTTTAGLVRLVTTDHFELFNTSNSPIPSNYNVNVAVDDSGGLWIGTGRWVEQDKSGFIYDKEGNVIIHEGQGFLHRDAQGNWGQVLNTSNSPLPDNTINVLLADGKHGVWIGTQKGGLTHYKSDGTWDVFNSSNSKLSGNNISSLLLDENGIWIGTANDYERDSQLNQIYDSSGNPIISSRNGLSYLDNFGRWTVFDSSNSNLTDSDGVLSITSDNHGGIWFSGSGYGGITHLALQEKQTGNRAAIIIAAGGSHAGNSLWDATESTSNSIYNMLVGRKFINEEIYYLSSKTWADFDGNGQSDRIVDAPSPERPLVLDDIQQAFEWAKKRGKLDQPLYVFFMDHGGTEKLTLNTAKNDYMSAADLKAMLDDYQTATGSQVVLVIEACYSGSLMPTLAAPNRAIIASAKENEEAYFSEKQGFMSSLGKYLKTTYFLDSFQNAKDQVPRQSPQLDDNGDGIYDNATDGKWLKSTNINGDIQTVNIRLSMENLTDSVTITSGQELLLQAKAVTESGEITRVWADIRPPHTNSIRDVNGTLSQPSLHTELFLYNDQEDVWQTKWKSGIYNGEYEITFHAQDDNGNIEKTEISTKIIVSGGIDPPAQAQVQIHLDKTRYQRGEQFKATLTEDLGWGYDLYAAVVMPDGNYFTLKDTNELRGVKEAEPWYVLRKQGQPITLFDLPLPTSLPTGQYCLYGILSPEKNDVFEARNKNLWVYGQQCFEVF